MKSLIDRRPVAAPALVLFTLAFAPGACIVAPPEAVSEQPAPPADTPVAVRSALSMPWVCGILDDHPGIGVLLDYASESLNLYENPIGNMIAAGTSACSSITSYMDCRDAGGSESSCSGQGLADGVCNFLGNSGLNQIHPLTVFARHYAQVVDPYGLTPTGGCSMPAEEAPPGESSLHCCKYTLDEPGCHSGFAAPSINCTIDYGNATLNSIGLPTCETHPECALSEPDEDSPASVEPPTLDQVERTMASIWRKKVEGAYANPRPVIGPYEDDANQPSACDFGALFRLGTFQGCRGWRAFVGETRPFAGHVKDWVTDGDKVAAGNEYQIYVSLLANYAAGRILLGIPHGPDRMTSALLAQVRNYYRSADEYIAELEEDRGIHLNAESELRAWLGPCALEILKADLPYGWWKMMAYPGLIEEPTTLNPASYEDACEMGGTPTLVRVELKKGASRWEKQLEIEASDPEQQTWASGGKTTVGFELVSGVHKTAFFDWQANAATSTNSFSYAWDNVQASPIVDIALINSAGNVVLRNELTVFQSLPGPGDIKVPPTTPGSRQP